MVSVSLDATTLVLMDISMPVMDGFTATGEIRASGQADLPIVAMTANAMAEDVARCREVGMQGHMAKPITLEKLRGVLALQLGPAKFTRGERASL